MKAAPEIQRRLLDIQAVDTAIAQLEHRKRALPEHAEIADGAKKRAAVLESITATQTEVSDLDLEVSKAESDLVPVRERKERNQQRVDAGAADPKALTALIDEIAHLGKRISDLEDAQLEVMEQHEDAVARLESLKRDRSEIDASLRALIARRDEQVADLDVQMADKAAERTAMVADVPADVLALYDRIREHGGGVGAAKLVGRRCTGCQIEATAADLARYQALPADEVARCVECERILVRGTDA